MRAYEISLPVPETERWEAIRSGIERFSWFVPTVGHAADFSELKDAVRSSATYRREAEGSDFAFVRGSAVSGYDGGIVRAHKQSDVDVIVVSPSARHSHVTHEVVSIPGGYMAQDIRTLCSRDMQREVALPGSRVSVLYDLVQDTYPLSGNEGYVENRRNALRVFLMLGLEREVRRITPSGAMFAINKAKLDINPLRWWSVEYALRKAPQAARNIARYYHDVADMLAITLVRERGSVNDEDVYRVPEDFALPGNARRLRSSYFTDRLIAHFHSTSLFSPNDVSKVGRKLQSLVTGFLEGKSDMNVLFPTRVGEAVHFSPLVR